MTGGAAIGVGVADDFAVGVGATDASPAFAENCPSLSDWRGTGLTLVSDFPILHTFVNSCCLRLLCHDGNKYKSDG